MHGDELDAAIVGELRELLANHERWRQAAADPTLSGHPRQAIGALQQPYEQTNRDARISLEDLCEFMAGGILPSDALDRLAKLAHCELVTRG